MASNFTGFLLKLCFTSFTILPSCVNYCIAQTPVLGHASAIWDGSGGTYFSGPFAMQIKGTYAYVATSSGLQVIDISTPASPTIVSSLLNENYNTIFDDARSIAISGGYALMTSHWNSKLIVVDITDPLKPVIAARISNGDHGAVLSFPQFIHISGKYAYIANIGNNSIEILDISTAAAPIHVGTILDGMNNVAISSPTSINVIETYAYVTCQGSSSIEVIDVSNPASPKHAGRLTNGAGGALLTQVQSICIQGNYAYAVGMGTNSLEIIDITNRSAPKHAGNILDGANGAFLNFPMSVSVAGNYAYVVSALSNALEIINITDPLNPIHAGSLKNGDGNAVLDNPVNVFISEANAYILSTNSASLEIADVSDPSTPFHKATIKNGDGSVKMQGPESVYVSGDYAYLACSRSNSLTVLNVSIPSKPRAAGIIRNGQNGANLDGASGVCISNGLAFVASRWGRALEIINVSDPTSPTHVSTLTDGENGAVLGDPYSLYVSDNYVFICNYYDSNLEIIDISNPLDPIHMASITTGILPAAVAVKNNYAYISTSHALQIIDISNPAAPFIASSFVDGKDGAIISGGSGLYLSEGYVYLTSAAGAVEIIDVSNPLLPKHTGKTTVASPRGISVIGNFAYVASWGGNSLVVLDISQKNNPILVTQLADGDAGATINGPTSIFVSNNNYCFMTEPSTFSVLHIIDLNGPNPPSFVQTTDSTSNSFSVKWRKELGASSYYVDLFNDVFGVYVNGFINVPVIDTSFVFSGLKPMNHYFYRVRSYNGKSTSLSSKEVHTFTFLTPTALAASDITPTSFTANWDPIVSDNWPNSYSFDIAVDESFNDSFNSIIPGQYTGVNISNLPNDLTYYYRIRAGGYHLINGDIVYSPYSNVIKVILSPITEVSNQVQACRIEAFPVPATTDINIVFNGFDDCCEVVYSIYNLIGQIIHEGRSSSLQTVSLPLTTFPAGYYTIKAVQNNKSTARNFVKN